MEPIIPTIIIKPEPYMEGLISHPHTAFEEMGRYVWAYIVQPQGWKMMSLPESIYHKGSFGDLRYFRLPTLQELLFLFDDEGKCRLPLLRSFLEKEFPPNIPFWSGEQLFDPGDSQTRGVTITAFGEVSVVWETQLALPIYVHVNEPNPMKLFWQPDGV